MQDASNIPKEYYNSTKPSEKLDPKWWRLDDDLKYQSVQAVVKNIKTKQIYRSTQNIRHARLYANLPIIGAMSNIFANSAFDLDLLNRLSLNVVKSCVDTAASKIAKMRPRPMFLTEGGDWAKQHRAKQLTKFMEGSFDIMNIYTKSQRQFVDGAVFGTGPMKFFIKDNKHVDCERVIPEEIIVDDAEGVYGTPMQMHQEKLIQRDVLMDMFPKKAQYIEQAKSTLTVEQASNPDFLKVTESWKLPSSGSAKDGARAITISTCTLDSEDWNKSYFPFTNWRWNPKLTGWYGGGLAEELMLLQLEIDKIMRVIQQSQHFMAVPRIFVEANSAVNTQHLTNQVAGIVKFTGQPPTFNTAPSVHPELYKHLWDLYQKAFEITGISMLSATSQKPAGLNSGEAIRTYQDVESDRFQLQGQRWEDVFMDASDIVIDLTEDLAKKNPGFEVKLSGGKYAETIRWSDVKMDKDDYVMRKFPTSILPSQPSGKLQKVQELAQAGFIDKDTAFSLLDFPDLEAMKSIQLLTQELTQKMLGQIVDEGTYMPPEPYMDPIVAQKLAQACYLDNKMKNCPDERLDLVRQFIDDCESLKTLAAQGKMQSQPLAAPTPAPRSDLLPNAPGSAPGQGVAQTV